MDRLRLHRGAGCPCCRAGKQGLGFIATTLLGIIGAFVGGFIASIFSGAPWRALHPSGFLGAIIGAIIILVIGEMMAKRR
jgi:uncharacterized membrane protein YeaQ/YmgE (transglycosylase-associated protein family)